MGADLKLGQTTIVLMEKVEIEEDGGGEGRQMAAGDSLRVIYSQLSQDPHSLANLDQDLPNYAQRMVPIFSLPQVPVAAAPPLKLPCNTYMSNVIFPFCDIIFPP